MRGSELEDARERLGRMWGFSRPLRKNELGRALQLCDGDEGRRIAYWERNDSILPGPAAVAVTMMLRGAMPPDTLEDIRGRR